MDSILDRVNELEAKRQKQQRIRERIAEVVYDRSQYTATPVAPGGRDADFVGAVTGGPTGGHKQPGYTSVTQTGA